MTTVVVVDEAERQLEEIHDWWRLHRPRAPSLVLDEFERCVTLLMASPGIRAPFRRTSIPNVRRIMTQTRHFLYYVHDSQHDVVYVLALWGAPKGSDPPLVDPR